MSDMNMNSCGNCVFRLGVKSQTEIGKVDHICRRYPPIPQVVQHQTNRGVQVQIISVWGQIPDAAAWCGEHQPTKPALSVVS